MTATASTTQAAAKTFVAFFTRSTDKVPAVELFKVVSDKQRAPMYSGKIDGKQVSLFLRHGANGNFLGLVGDNNVDLGTANIRTRVNGAPVLVLYLRNEAGEKTPVFASVSKKVDDQTLVELGLNLEKRAAKVAAASKARQQATVH